jgi:NAD+ synthase (glutamine-hydrolysing)
MDGDTCGGLAPIAGIDKAYLRRWLAWLATKGGEGLGPLPALQAVVSQRSTPELRPSAARQVSEEDLMPFDVLDVVERLAIRDKLPPVDVFMRLRRERPQDDPRQLGAWIERFFRLFATNQWKRERYAPSFHLDDENLDPKTWCRFPILSGGFARELAALRLRVAELATPQGASTKGESA